MMSLHQKKPSNPQHDTMGVRERERIYMDVCVKCLKMNESKEVRILGFSLQLEV